MIENSELYLIRHGIAVDPADAETDELRPLTARGKVSLERIAAGLNALSVTFDVIISSPLVRARQTAAVLAESMTTAKSLAPIVVTEALTPGASPPALIEELARQTSARRVALVGHEPGIGRLAAWLLGGDAAISLNAISFKKGGVCRIDFSASPAGGAGTLRWFAPPKMLRLIGRSD